MVELSCECGHSDAAPESTAGGIWACPACGRQIQLACAETLPDGAGQGDFDASLTIIDGPDRVSQKILLGGVASIEIGKADAKHIHLPGQRISRNHCKLNRLDFGPSRWEVEDQNATNGTSINGQKIAKQELKPGDTLQTGEYQLLFDLAAPMQPTAVAGEEIATALPEAQPSAPPPPPMPTAKKASPAGTKAKARPAQAQTLAYESASAAEGPRLLSDSDINWVMRLRNAATLMCWTVLIKYVIFMFGLRFVMWLIPYAYETRDIVISILMVGAIWLLTSKEPGVQGDIFGVRMLLRIIGTVGYAADIALTVAHMAESDLVIVLSLGRLVQVPAIALLLFYMRRLSLRIPNQSLAFSLTLLMVAMPAFVAMGLWAAYQATQGATEQAVGFGLLALIGILVCEIGRLGCLVWFSRSFS